jgi:hypothetical protein
MKSIVFVTVLAWLLGVFGAFVLPRAASPDLPQAGPMDRANIVLGATRPNDEWCPWKRRAETTVQLYSDA